MINNHESKILLIDDEIELLNLIQTVLTKEGFKKIHTAMSGMEGIELCRRVNPDLIVLDIMLPDIDGFQVCHLLREITFVPIIFLSAKSEDVDKLLGLSIGGDDYVTKPFSPREIAFRIKAHLRRQDYLVKDLKADKRIIEFDNFTIDDQKAEVRKNEQVINLTAKEFQILFLLASHPNQIFSKQKIYDQVWGQNYIGDQNTIMVHIRHLREKIEDNPSVPKYILTVKGLGYKLSVKG